MWQWHSCSDYTWLVSGTRLASVGMYNNGPFLRQCIISEDTDSIPASVTPMHIANVLYIYL